MKSILIASGAVVTSLALASLPARSEGQLYLNPEFNQGWVGGSETGGLLDLHVGLEEGPFYIQAGPALAVGGGESEWGITGKTGVSGKVSDNMDLYAEASIGKFDDADTAYGLKVGSKFRF